MYRPGRLKKCIWSLIGSRGTECWVLIADEVTIINFLSIFLTFMKSCMNWKHWLLAHSRVISLVYDIPSDSALDFLKHVHKHYILHLRQSYSTAFKINTLTRSSLRSSKCSSRIWCRLIPFGHALIPPVSHGHTGVQKKPFHSTKFTVLRRWLLHSCV